MRVTFIGLPYSGKTFWATYLTSLLNQRGLITELVMEPFKDWYYLGMPLPDCYTELSAFFDIARREEKRLTKGAECVVSDSGLWTILYYISKMSQDISIRTCLDVIFRIESRYQSINILVPPRPADEAVHIGRWADHVGTEEARAAQFQELKDVLNRYRCHYIEATDTEAVVDDVAKRLLRTKGIKDVHPASRRTRAKGKRKRA